MDSELKKLTDEVIAFSTERDWDQFHNPKDLAIALSIEASELLEAFLWKSPQDADPVKVREELADVVNYCIQLADKCGIDIYEAVREKMKQNALKYPVEKARGTAKKYNEL